MLGQITVILTGYLLGSIPFAYLLTRLATGRDIRYVGDGNAGARSAIHVAGRVPGLLTLFLDIGKGAAGLGDRVSRGGPYRQQSSSSPGA